MAFTAAQYNRIDYTLEYICLVLPVTMFVVMFVMLVLFLLLFNQVFPRLYFHLSILHFIFQLK